MIKTAILAAGLAVATTATALAQISATTAGQDMLHEMEISLVTANNRLAQVPLSDLSQVTDIIAHLGNDARVVHDAFYNNPVDTSGVCSRDDIIQTMDELNHVVLTYRDNLGNPPADLVLAFELLTDRLDTIEHRLADAMNQAEAGC